MHHVPARDSACRNWRNSASPVNGSIRCEGECVEQALEAEARDDVAVMMTRTIDAKC